MNLFTSLVAFFSLSCTVDAANFNIRPRNNFKPFQFNSFMVSNMQHAFKHKMPLMIEDVKSKRLDSDDAQLASTATNSQVELAVEDTRIFLNLDEAEVTHKSESDQANSTAVISSHVQPTLHYSLFNDNGQKVKLDKKSIQRINKVFAQLNEYRTKQQVEEARALLNQFMAILNEKKWKLFVNIEGCQPGAFTIQNLIKAFSIPQSETFMIQYDTAASNSNNQSKYFQLPPKYIDYIVSGSEVEKSTVVVAEQQSSQNSTVLNVNEIPGNNTQFGKSETVVDKHVAAEQSPILLNEIINRNPKDGTNPDEIQKPSIKELSIKLEKDPVTETNISPNASAAITTISTILEKPNNNNNNNESSSSTIISLNTIFIFVCIMAVFATLASGAYFVHKSQVEESVEL